MCIAAGKKKKICVFVQFLKKLEKTADKIFYRMWMAPVMFYNNNNNNKWQKKFIESQSGSLANFCYLYILRYFTSVQWILTCACLKRHLYEVLSFKGFIKIIASCLSHYADGKNYIQLCKSRVAIWFREVSDTETAVTILSNGFVNLTCLLRQSTPSQEDIPYLFSVANFLAVSQGGKEPFLKCEPHSTCELINSEERCYRDLRKNEL